MLSPCNQNSYPVRPGRYPWLDTLMVLGDEYTTKFSRSERRAFRKQKFQKPSEWIPKNRKIVKGDFAGNYMSFDITPHLRGILDASALPFIREIILNAAPQTAKTTGIDSYVAWSRIFDKGPACSFYPDEVTAKRSMDERIAPLVKGSPALKRQIMPGRNAITAISVSMAGGNWEVGWAGSTAQTADRPLKIVDMQEINKPAYGKSGDETGAVYLLRQRVRSYRGHKIFMSSTPTTESGNITVLLDHECEAVFVQWVRCPHCHEELFMQWSESRFYWPTELGPDGIERAIDRKTIKSKELGRYVCQSCGALWDDNDRNKAIRRETWRLRVLDDNGETDPATKGEEMFRYLHRERPGSIGFILPSWMSYMVSLSEVVHDYLRSQDPALPADERLKAEKDFANAHEASAWKPETKARKTDSIIHLKDDRPEGIVPSEGVAALIAGVDTQDHGLWYWIHAVGYGLTSPQRWLIRCGLVPAMADIYRIILEDEYRDVNDNVYPVRLALQDALGHNTAEVYDFCESTRGMIIPTIGRQTMAVPYDSRPVEFYPGADKKPFPGALRRLNVNSSLYKDRADGILKTNRDDPGGLALHSEVSELHLAQLCAEVRGEDGFWHNPKKRDNHLWDCLYLALCAETVLGVKHWAVPGEGVVPGPVVKKSKKVKRSRW